ncbi:MAG: hypothetical protein U0787_07060 [Polyangia bacterium]
MREQFSRHAPRLPDAKMPVTHLALAPGPTSRQLHGLVMSSDCNSGAASATAK